jgi:hypothetical protein
MPPNYCLSSQEELEASDAAWIGPGSAAYCQGTKEHYAALFSLLD